MYGILTLICILAIAFLLMCLQGFQSALKRKFGVRSVLVKIKEENSFEFPRGNAQLISFPQAAALMRSRSHLRKTGNIHL